MTDPRPTVLNFPDKRRHRRFPVAASSGETVASISTSWTGTSFSVDAKDGHRLCQASAGLWGLSPTWQATDSKGDPLLRLSRRLLANKADVRLARGGDYLVRGSVWKRDFVVTDYRDRVVVVAVPRTSAVSLHPNDYAVEQTSGAFQLDELVALVQIWRMVQKGDSNTTAANSATWSGGTYS
jgi:uncharacterized protein YxjI